MRFTIIILLLIIAVAGVPGCKTATDKDKMPEEQTTPQDKPEEGEKPTVPTKVSEEFKTKMKQMIIERKFFQVYKELSLIENKDDWVIANLLFASHALKKLEGSDIMAPKEADAKRAQAKKLIEKKQYYEALDILATMTPKTDQDITYIMAAGYSLFKESGSKQITRYLGTILVGFVHARMNKNKKLEQDCLEALERLQAEDLKKVSKEEYKQALINAMKFFEKMSKDFKELTDKHLLRCGYNHVQINVSEAEIVELLQRNIKANNDHSTYTEIYLWWHRIYKEFKAISLKLLLQSAMK